MSSPPHVRQARAEGADGSHAKDALRGRVQGLVALDAAAAAAAARPGLGLPAAHGHEAPAACSCLNTADI